MATKSSGFTLIELLVVVAIIGILSSIGVVAYSGYVGAAKISSTKSVMQQIALMQTEYLSSAGGYYTTDASGPTTCTTTDTKSDNIEIELFPAGTNDAGEAIGEDIITSENDFLMCILETGPGYLIVAENDSGCKLTLSQAGILNDDECGD